MLAHGTHSTLPKADGKELLKAEGALQTHWDLSYSSLNSVSTPVRKDWEHKSYLQWWRINTHSGKILKITLKQFLN